MSDPTQSEPILSTPAEEGSVPGFIEPSQTAVFGSLGAEDLSVERVALTSADQAAVDALPPHSALLVVQRGPNAGARFLLDADKTTAGRHPASDIFLDDVTVSRKHAVFVAVTDGFMVRDCGSLNGTYVNRERIDTCLLSCGDEVQIGKFRMTYQVSPNRDK